MFKQIALSILVIALMLNITFSQNPSSYKFTTDDGLPHQTIFKVFQASNGYVWFATGLGVSRYDGYKFENFAKYDNLSSNIIIDIFEDKTNTLWFVGEDKTLSYFKNNRFYKYKYNAIVKSKIIEKYPNKVRILDKNSVCYYFDNKKAITINSAGKIEKKLCSYEEHWENIKTKDAIYYWNKNKIIRETNSIAKTNFTLNYNISALEINVNRDIIIGSESGGLKIYKKGNLNAKPQILLSKERVTSILVDKEDGTWVSTNSSGVFYFPMLYVESYNNLSSSNFKLKTAIINDNEIITMYCNGVIKFNYSDSTEERLIKLPDSCATQGLYYNETNKSTIALTRESIFSIDKNFKIKKVFSLEQKYNSIYDVRDKKISIDENGNYWIADHTKLVCFNNNSKIKEIDLLELKSKIYTFCIGDKDILLGTETGLWKYINDSLYYLGEKNNLYKEEITSIQYNDQFVVFGTLYSGIIVSMKDTVYQLKMNNGLLSNSINSIDLKDNTLWVSSNSGVSKIYLDMPFNSDEIENYTKTSGLISNKIQKTIIKDSIVYVISNKGINSFNFVSNTINKNKPILIIKDIIAAKGAKISQNNYHLKHNRSSFVVDYIGINFKSMSGVKYFYKLEGLDNRWQKTNNTKISYPSLPHGNYVLRIEAESTSGVFSDTINIYIEVDKPFWLSWVFRLIVILSILIISYTFFSVRSKIKLRKNKIKRIIDSLQYQALNKQMNPHFIFNSLNSIHNYILQNDVKNSSKYLNKFSMLIRMVLDNSQHQLVSIKKETEAIGIYMELESNRFKDRFVFNIDIKDEVDIYLYKIPPLIIQPFVENAIWHGLMNQDKYFDGKVKVSFSLENKRIICKVIDNGVGRKKAGILNNEKQKNNSLGIKITTRRKELINALNNSDISIKYIDLHDKSNQPIGTEVIINFPIFI